MGSIGGLTHRVVGLLVVLLSVNVAAADHLYYHGSGMKISIGGDNLTTEYGPNCTLETATAENQTSFIEGLGFSAISEGGKIELDIQNGTIIEIGHKNVTKASIGLDRNGVIVDDLYLGRWNVSTRFETGC